MQGLLYPGFTPLLFELLCPHAISVLAMTKEEHLKDDGFDGIKIIPFSGKKGDWPVWSEKFLARTRRRGYCNVLLADDKTPAALDKPANTATQEDKDT
jgi:hypothetical protein